jgi:phage shock protein A
MGSSPQPPERNDPQSGLPEHEPAADYVDGVPTFDFVRDKIEGRYATAQGSTELAEESAAGRSVAQQQEDRDAAARERLEQIRKSLRGE